MGMPRGLAKATNYYNRIEAINDWNKLATQVSNAGMSDLAAKFRPAEDAGWRKIDKATAALREAFQQNAHLTPESLASSQAVSNASAVSQSDSDTPPAQAQVA